MQVKAMSYELEPRVSLYLVPETDVERVLLRSLWKHGALERCNGCADGTGEGFVILQQRIPKGEEGE